MLALRSKPHPCIWPSNTFSHFARAKRFRHSLSHDLRALLRETAQPVAVVTCCTPPSTSPTPIVPKFHGATLSSFTSVALEPFPVVSFALRLPSRMSQYLRARYSSNHPSPLPFQDLQEAKTSHMVVNLLCASQAATAHHFAQPSPFEAQYDTEYPYSLSEEGIPILQGSLGALSCSVLSITPLYAPGATVREGTLSELILARVVRVEKCVGGGEQMPLVYHRRKYTTLS
ncbi:flavin reductase like domain-containing protein [Flagelloscypha sp. PMI_526]|nr:flavin reductase like domain-containing protein [Flagelloscypha sp. PMI_526]